MPGARLGSKYQPVGAVIASPLKLWALSCRPANSNNRDFGPDVHREGLQRGAEVQRKYGCARRHTAVHRSAAERLACLPDRLRPRASEGDARRGDTPAVVCAQDERLQHGGLAAARAATAHRRGPAVRGKAFGSAAGAGHRRTLARIHQAHEHHRNTGDRGRRRGQTRAGVRHRQGDSRSRRRSPRTPPSRGSR